jgi:hypothetical protein
MKIKSLKHSLSGDPSHVYLRIRDLELETWKYTPADAPRLIIYELLAVILLCMPPTTCSQKDGNNQSNT